MADLAASDVTITLQKQDRDFTQFKKLNLVLIEYGDGALTVPAGGIPLPSIGQFGMNKFIDAIIPLGFPNGYLYEYDKANHKLVLRFFDYDAVADGVAIAATGEAPAATDLYAWVLGN